MDKDKYILLIYKQLKQEISQEEQAELTQWLSESPDNQAFAATIKQDWELSAKYDKQLEIDVQGDFELLRQRMRTEQPSASSSGTTRSLSPARQWMLHAAAIALLVAAGWWIYLQFADTTEQLIGCVLVLMSSKK